jgi:Fe-S cluster biogenesis protein NfuA
MPTTVITVAEAEAILAWKVRPAIRGHAGDVHVVEVSDQGDVKVEFSGACRACPLQPVTLGTAIQPAFEGVPGVRNVHCETVRVSAYALRRISALMQSSAPTQESLKRG